MKNKQGRNIARRHNRSALQPNRIYYFIGSYWYPWLVSEKASNAIKIEAPNYHTAKAAYQAIIGPPPFERTRG